MNPTVKKVIGGLVALCIVIGLAAGFYAVGGNNKEVVASINGETISKDELYAFMLQQGGQEALDAMITQKVVEMEANKQRIMATDDEIQKELNTYYEYYGGEAALKEALASSGLSVDDLKKDLATNIKIDKMLEPRISITEEEMKAYFEQNKESFDQKEQVKASHILVDTLDKAKEMKEKLDNGEDFAALAKANSTDEGTKNNGGDLGFFGAGDMVKEFAETAFALPIGKISDPVKTEYGYHIIKVVEKKPAKAADYAQSKEKIRKILFGQKAQTEYPAWFAEIKQQYNIVNSLTR